MPNLSTRAHLREALRWSPDGKIEVAAILAAGLGMACPVLLAMQRGHLELGLAAAIGGLAVGRVEIGAGLQAHAKSELDALVPIVLAALCAALLGGYGWLSNVGLLLLSGIAAVISGFSRFMVVAATRFVLFLMIVSAVPPAAEPVRALTALGFVGLISAGAFWTSGLSLLFGALARRTRQAAPEPADAPVRVPTARQKFVRWRRSLAAPAGWSYPARLVTCLAIATGLDIAWPNHHFHWIGLTVAILTPRHVETVPIKATQRALGTALGVAAAGIFLRLGLPAWALVVAIGLLAAVRPVLRGGNYLAYSAVMTPLIILLIDAGRTLENDLLLDRLVATLIGASLVVGANLLFVQFTARRNENTSPPAIARSLDDGEP